MTGMTETTAATNIPELSVSDLSGALKRTIEDRFGFVRVRGEISNYRGPHGSGHAYFCLKDEGARIDAVIWKGNFIRLKTKPQEGLEVIATGKVSTFPGKSTYQLIIESLEPAGLGALMALFEERRRRLAAEGLFDEARKQLLPFLPERIGVVTSPTGAVIRDILHRIADRFPRHVVVWPVRVQGETSAAEVAAAIEGFNRLPEEGPLRRPDLIIVARGGGSLEDLWGFNEEIVVRAAANSFLPLISAIGHETDWTLIDYASDLRAPTPTGAAEKAVPVRLDLLSQLGDLDRRHYAAMQRLLDRRQSELRGLIRALPQGDAITSGLRQRLDHTGVNLTSALARSHDRQRIALGRLAHRLAQQSPHARVARVEQRLQALEKNLRQCLVVAMERRNQSLAHAALRLVAARQGRFRIEQERISASRKALTSLSQRHARFAETGLMPVQQKLSGLAARLALAQRKVLASEAEKLSGLRKGLDALASRQARSFEVMIAKRAAKLSSLGQLLQSLGYRQVLGRGFALVRDERDRPLRFAAEIVDGARLSLEFADGRKQAIADGEAALRPTEVQRPVSPPKKPIEKPAKQKDGQGSLF